MLHVTMLILRDISSQHYTHVLRLDSLWAESAVYNPKTAVAVLELSSLALPHFIT